MEYNYIFDPINNRRVNIFSYSAKNILNNYINSYKLSLQFGGMEGKDGGEGGMEEKDEGEGESGGKGGGEVVVCEDKDILLEWSNMANDKRENTGDNRRERGNRGEIDGNPFWSHTSDEETVGKNVILQWHSGKELSEKESKTIREKTLKQYTVNDKIKKKLNSKSFTWINQGEVGGCSFAAMVNLCQLCGIKTPWEVSELSTEAGFRKIYIGEYGCDDSGYNDWLTVLQSDFINKIPCMNSVLRNIQYTPFKISKLSCHNTDFGKGISKEKYGGLVFNYIKTLLDEGNVVAIPFLQHFITIIGYKGDQLLFLGSFGGQNDKGGLHEMGVTFTAMHMGDAIQSCIYAPLK